MAEQELCEMELRLRVLGDGLLGGTHEYAPMLALHGTWGAYKVRRRMALCATTTTASPSKNQTLGASSRDNTLTYEGPVLQYEAAESLRMSVAHGAQTRGDDAVWFELWCYTRDTGIAEMDARESRYAQRQTCCGTHQLQLYSVFAQAQREGDTFTVQAPLLDHKILEIKLREYAQQGVQITDANRPQYLEQAARETHKGVLTIDVRLHRLNPQMLRASIFGQPRLQQEALSAVMALGHRHHQDDDKSRLPHWHRDTEFYRDKQGHARVRRRMAYGADEQSTTSTTTPKAFTPILYTSSRGVQQIVGAMERDVLTPYGRYFLSMQGQPALYGPANANVANLHLLMWISKMGRLPVYAYFCHDPSTRQYATPELKARDEALYGFNAHSEQLMLLMLRSSLRRHGMSAATFERVLSRHYDLKNRATQLDPLMRRCEEVVADTGTFAACLAYYMADVRFVDQSGPQQHRLRALMVALDSWDNAIPNGVANSDDCEGLQAAASAIIRAYAMGRHDLQGQWASSLMQTVALHLRHTVIYDVGATVTSAYVDTNNNKVDLRKQRDLPMVGDAMDLKSEVAGHCHGLMESLTNATRRLAQGNVAPDVVAKVRAASLAHDAAFAERDAQRHVLVLEATGSIEPYQLPLQETHSGVELQKREGEREFMRETHRRLEARRNNKELEISDMFVGEGMPYYSEKQDARRRITPFYNEVVHGCSLELMRHDDSLSQFAFCRSVEGQWRYGCKIADVLRTPEDCALVTPFAESVHEWREHVRPVVETMQHQLPLMAFGRYSAEDYAQVHSTYNRHADIGAAHSFASTPESQKASQEAAAFEAAIASVAEDPNRSVVRFYMRAERLQADAKATAALKQFFAAAPGMVQHALFTEKHLPQCPALIEGLFIIDVRACLALRKENK